MGETSNRILLIDDDLDFHGAVKMILEPLGYQITCAATGPEGIETLRKSPFDLILLDIMLSSPLEGFYLMDEIRRDKALKHIPVIMISAIGQSMGLDYAREMGTGLLEADLFLEKPVQAAQLRQAVADVLARRKNASATSPPAQSRN